MSFKKPFNRCYVNYNPESLNRSINEVLNNNNPVNLPKFTKFDKAAIACFVAGDVNSPEAKIIQSAMYERVSNREIPTRKDGNAPRLDEKQYFFEKNVKVSAEIQTTIDKLSALAFLTSPKEAAMALGCVLFELQETYSRLRQEIKFGRL